MTPALDPGARDVFRSAAAEILAIVAAPTVRRDAQIDALADVLEELTVRVLIRWADGALGEPPADRVTGTPLHVWPVLRDLRTRIDRIDHAGEGVDERLAELDRHMSARIDSAERELERRARDLEYRIDNVERRS